MNGIVLMVVAAAALAVGYLGYGRWLANKWGVDREAITPARRMEDGKNFSPASAFTAFSHPVSYTHLDVYKRQRIGCASAAN